MGFQLSASEPIDSLSSPPSAIWSRDLALICCDVADSDGAELPPVAPGWLPQAVSVSASVAASGAASRVRSFTLPPEVRGHGANSRDPGYNSNPSSAFWGWGTDSGHRLLTMYETRAICPCQSTFVGLA